MRWEYTPIALHWRQVRKKTLVTWGTVYICLHLPIMQQQLYLLVVPIRIALYQMRVQITTVIIQMGLKVLFSVEKRQIVAFLSKATEKLKHP